MQLISITNFDTKFFTDNSHFFIHSVNIRQFGESRFDQKVHSWCAQDSNPGLPDADESTYYGHS